MSAGIEESGKGMKLPTRILLGLVVGAVLGIAANLQLGATSPFVVNANKFVAGPIGQIFLNLLFMVVMPLVFASIALGVAGLGDIRKVGTVGTKAIGYFRATTAAAATLGLIIVQFTQPGKSIPQSLRDELMTTFAADAGAKVTAAEQGNFGIQTFVNIVTRNPIKSAVDMDMLGVIFFGLMFGAALTLILKELAAPMLAWLQALEAIVVKIIAMAMSLAPYGVAALIFGVTSRFGFSLMGPLAVFILTVIGALLLHVALTISGILRFAVGISPFTFFKRIRSAIVTAFSTSSSAATLPTNLNVATQNLGVPQHIAGFVLPIGTTMCMNGTALFEGITVIFLAQVFGIELSIVQQGFIMIMCVLTAVGAAGVPGGSIPLLVGVLAMFGVPAEGIALVLGVDRILDMSRTAVNVIGDQSATLFVAKSEGEWTLASLPPEGGEVRTKLDESPGWP